MPLLRSVIDGMSEPQPGGDGAPACPLTQALPDREGKLFAREGCGLEHVSTEDRGIEDPCEDEGVPGQCVAASMLLTVGGQTEANGQSPLSLAYTVALSELPANVRIEVARSVYESTGSFLDWNISDEGGSAAIPSATIPWLPQGIAALNAALLEGTFTVQTSFTFVSDPPGETRTWRVTQFVVGYCGAEV